MNDQVIAIGDQRPEVYSESTIYDPDIHGSDTSVLGGLGGPYVPQLDALVMDMKGRLKRVVSVDPDTYKVTYARIHTDSDGKEDSLINYGNEIYCIYYDNAINPNKLIIDAKVAIFGTNAYEYRLMKVIEGAPISIGLYIDIHGTVQGDRIPMIESGVSSVKTCANAYTNIVLHPNELVNMEIYDSNGEMLSEIKLISCKANAISQLPVITNPIVDFVIHSSQERGNEIICYSDQDVTEIGLYPTIVYSDGSTQSIAIDGQDCIMYGLEHIVQPYIGTRFKLICKYYPGVTTDVADGAIAPGLNHLIAEKYVVIEEREEHQIAKVSLLPVWDSNMTGWKIRARAYKFDRSSPEDVTAQIHWINGINTALYNSEQLYNLEIRDGDIVLHSQIGSVTLRQPTHAIPWIIDTYGGDSPLSPRPFISCVEDVYFIDANKFPDVGLFLQSFFMNAVPPYNVPGGETETPTPTHFVIRDIEFGQMIVPEVLPIDDYSFILNIIEDSSSLYKDTNVIIEFLIEVGSAAFSTIYGVPVEIK